MPELIAWSRDFAFGFPKHPPFAAIARCIPRGSSLSLHRVVEDNKGINCRAIDCVK
jgi:hypothetical protein